MKNKGYYGWIHSLNQAGMQAQVNGFEILTEQRTFKGTFLTEEVPSMGKAKRITGKKAEDISAVLNYKQAPKEYGQDIDDVYMGNKGAPIITDQETAIQSGGGDYSDYSALRDSRKPFSPRNPTPETIKTGQHRSVRSEFGNELGPHAGTEYIPGNRLPDYGMDAERALTAQLAQQKLVKDSIPAGNANAVANDASDGVMGDEEPENEGQYEFPTKNWKTFKESVSQKISRMLRN
jgi:hypothetical protein